MIVVPGSNTLGNVINLILGPESELIADIHGAAVMDVTDAVLPLLTNGNRIFVSVSRCRNEVSTTATLRSNKIAHVSTFSEAASKVREGDTGTTLVADKPDSVPAPAAIPNTLENPAKKCDYCGQVEDLVKDIPNIHICKSCIQIELGCKRKKRA